MRNMVRLRMSWLMVAGTMVVLFITTCLPMHGAAQQPQRWLADPELITTRKVIGADGGAFREVRNTVIDIDMIDAQHGWAVDYRGVRQFDGRWWKPTVDFGNRVSLRGLDMLNTTDGWVVGSSFVAGAPSSVALARYNGSEWQQPFDIVHRDGSTGSLSGSLAAVSALSSTSAVAVGLAFEQASPGNYRQRPLLLVFDGAVWRDQTPPSWRDGQLTSLSMVSPTEGWAAGILGRPGGEGSEAVRPAIVHLKDGQWTEEALPSLPISDQPFTMYDLDVRPNGVGYAIFYDYGTDCPNSELLRYRDGRWTAVARTTYGNAPIIAFALVPGTEQGWATQSGCTRNEASRPNQRVRFDNGTFRVDSSGSSLGPTVYGLFKSDVQWAAAGGAMMRYSAETLPTARQEPGLMADTLYFEQTGHYVDDLFLQYYRTHGLEMGDPGVSEREALALFGYPISEGFDEINPDRGEVIHVQYFERARFEYHRDNPEPFKVLLGRLGAHTLLRLGRDFGSTAPPDPRPECQSFAESPFPLCQPFRDFWNQSGGLPVFGFPLTIAAKEQSQTDRQSYLTQWFERERLEYHPDKAGTPYAVLLGLLGSEELRIRGYLPQ